MSIFAQFLLEIVKYGPEKSRLIVDDVFRLSCLHFKHVRHEFCVPVVYLLA